MSGNRYGKNTHADDQFTKIETFEKMEMPSQLLALHENSLALLE